MGIFAERKYLKPLDQELMKKYSLALITQFVTFLERSPEMETPLKLLQGCS